MDLLAFSGFKLNSRAGVIVLQFRLSGNHLIGAPHIRFSKRLVENDYKIVFEIIGNTAAVAGGVTNHFIFGGDQLNV